MEKTLKVLKPVKTSAGYHAEDRDGNKYFRLHQGALSHAYEHNQALKETSNGRFSKVDIAIFNNNKDCGNLVLLCKPNSKNSCTIEQIASHKELERWSIQVYSWVGQTRFNSKSGEIIISGIRGYEVPLITILPDGTKKSNNCSIENFDEFTKILRKNGRKISFTAENLETEIFHPYKLHPYKKGLDGRKLSNIENIQLKDQIQKQRDFLAGKIKKT